MKFCNETFNKTVWNEKPCRVINSEKQSISHDTCLSISLRARETITWAVPMAILMTQDLRGARFIFSREI